MDRVVGRRALALGLGAIAHGRDHLVDPAVERPHACHFQVAAADTAPEAIDLTGLMIMGHRLTDPLHQVVVPTHRLGDEPHLLQREQAPAGRENIYIDPFFELHIAPPSWIET